jgi:hypothetical protein
VTKPSPPHIEDALLPVPIPSGPTPSEIINNAPLIALTGKPELSERFEEEGHISELWYSVKYETKASSLEVDAELSRYFEGFGYELNPDRSVWFSNESLPSGSCGFSYWTENGKHILVIEHIRFFDPGTYLEEAISNF